MQHPIKDCAKCGVLTGESADREIKSASVAERMSTWSRTSHRTGVRLEVVLSLGLIN